VIPRPSDSTASRLLGVEWAGLGDDPLAELMVFEGAGTAVELDQRMRREVETEISRVVDLVDECDAFDLVELLRLRELPIDPAHAVEPGFDGSGAVVELITVVLLARGRRAPLSMKREDSRPHELIGDLHERAKRLLRLSSYRTFWSAQLSDRGSFARLAGEYQSFFATVRGHQYRSVQEEHDRALFDRPDTDELLSEHLGFTYKEFVSVRDAISDLYNSRMMALRDRTGDLVEKTQAEGREPTAEEGERFMRDMIDFMFLPGRRASFRSTDIAQRIDLDLAKIESVLKMFSSDFDDSVRPADVMSGFLRGRNPLMPASLVRDGTEHIMTTGPIGADAFRAVAESAIKSNQRAWNRYDQKIRSVVSEDLAVAAIGRLLRAEAMAAPLEYVAAKGGAAPSVVGEACAQPLSSGDLVEGDALFVVGDVAVCVEVKGRTVAEAARRGDLSRLEREAKSILGVGTDQARRLELLIRTNGGVWRKDATWFDLSEVREIHTVVVGLDTFGPLGVSLGDLNGAAFHGDGTVPWITSLHDLDVISRAIDRPSEFLLYLRRRTGPGIAENYRGVDELDLFMLFMDGGLYVEPDPDTIHKTHPRSRPPTKKARRRHQEQSRSTFVGTHTDDLDRWMYASEGSSVFDAPKPVHNSHESAVELVDLLQNAEAPGWLRFGADLLALSGETQQRLGAALDDLARQTRRDGEYHTLAQGFAGNSGFPTLFAACAPKTMPLEEAAEHLRIYVEAKKHQLRSDRALGLLFNDQREVVGGLYMNDLPMDAPELDELGGVIGLKQTWTEASAPKASNKERRRRRKVKKRKRRRS
jgi:hypothetical protein